MKTQSFYYTYLQPEKGLLSGGASPYSSSEDPPTKQKHIILVFSQALRTLGLQNTGKGWFSVKEKVIYFRDLNSNMVPSLVEGQGAGVRKNRGRRGTGGGRGKGGKREF